MAIFNALLNLRELKELYSGKPVCVCPLYKGVINVQKTFEATGNPIILPEYKSLVKLKTTFSPKQAGTGDPSPDNIRPISGWDSLTVTQSVNDTVKKTVNLTLPETIYGGTVDAVTGVGSKEWEFVEFDGTERWSLYGDSVDGQKAFFTNIGVEIYKDYITILCDRAKWHFKNWSIYVPWSISGSPYSNAVYIAVPNSIALTTDEWKSYLATQVSAGTPVQIAYKLATPESFKVSQVSIPSLRGENYFFTNGENMDIIYKKESFWSDEA